jgi:hypothetical protein
MDLLEAALALLSAWTRRLTCAHSKVSHCCRRKDLNRHVIERWRSNMMYRYVGVQKDECGGRRRGNPLAKQRLALAGLGHRDMDSPCGLPSCSSLVLPWPRSVKVSN